MLLAAYPWPLAVCRLPSVIFCLPLTTYHFNLTAGSGGDVEGSGQGSAR